MKKKSMILSAILVTVLAFTGCGNTQTNTSNTTSDTDGSQPSISLIWALTVGEVQNIACPLLLRIE